MTIKDLLFIIIIIIIIIILFFKVREREKCVLLRKVRTGEREI